MIVIILFIYNERSKNRYACSNGKIYPKIVYPGLSQILAKSFRLDDCNKYPFIIGDPGSIWYLQDA